MKSNKKLCIEYIQKMKSPIEEMAGINNGNGQKPRIADLLNRVLMRNKQPQR